MIIIIIIIHRQHHTVSGTFRFITKSFSSYTNVRPHDNDYLLSMLHVLPLVNFTDYFFLLTSAYILDQRLITVELNHKIFEMDSLPTDKTTPSWISYLWRIFAKIDFSWSPNILHCIEMKNSTKHSLQKPHTHTHTAPLYEYSRNEYLRFFLTSNFKVIFIFTVSIS